MPQSDAEMLITSDDLGRRVAHRFPPQRIVSLCPSQTETLIALGVGDRLVGRTRYCVHPEAQVRRITVVGGTKQLRLDAVQALAPDLVVAEKEENRREDVEALAVNLPVFVTDVRDFDGALRMIRRLGEICDVLESAEALAKQIDGRWRRLEPLSNEKSVAYLIWRKPWMAAGGDCYINDALKRCGFRNIFAEHAGRYPETTLDEIVALAPEIVLLSSEPYPFTEAHRREFASRLPGSKVLLVDGETFSWYGARMLQGGQDLQALINGLQ